MSHLIQQPARFIKAGIRCMPRRHEPTTPFRWPLDTLGDLTPRVLAAHEGDRPGVVLGYERAPLEPVPVIAANDGEVSLALEGGGGYAVSLDHGRAWSTHYTGLSSLAVIRCLPRRKLRQSVHAGDVIGYARSKLGFELWRWTDDRGFVPVDPRSHLACWVSASVKPEATNKEAA